MTQIENQKSQLAETIRSYHQKGWSPATSTNYSFRMATDLDRIYVSRSGVDKSQFLPTDFMEIDRFGNPTPDFHAIKPSAETLIHCVLYDLFPDTEVILHSHSIYSVLMSQRFAGSVPFRGYEIQKGFQGQTTHDAEIFVPILENSQDMVEFSAWMHKEKAEFSNHCFIIRNHGAYAWGRNLFEAKRHLETLEYLLQVEFLKR